MRLWSLHPKYLDPRGLTSLWREALLAQKVLQNRTIGYRNHPQLERFKKAPDPLAAVGSYLSAVFHESKKRGYNFSGEKILTHRKARRIVVTAGQVEYEWGHYLRKIKKRSPELYNKYKLIGAPDVHPLFRVVVGDIESWEKT